MARQDTSGDVETRKKCGLHPGIVTRRSLGGQSCLGEPGTSVSPQLQDPRFIISVSRGDEGTQLVLEDELRLGGVNASWRAREILVGDAVRSHQVDRR
jgi:hypothetical protein